jgi:hypothetical protein
MLSLRGLYDRQTVVGSTALGTLTKEHSAPYISSSGVATSLDTPILVAHDKEEDDGICGGSGDPSIRLENLAQEQEDSGDPGRPTIEGAAI